MRVSWKAAKPITSREIVEVPEGCSDWQPKTIRTLVNRLTDKGGPVGWPAPKFGWHPATGANRRKTHRKIGGRFAIRKLQQHPKHRALQGNKEVADFFDSAGLRVLLVFFSAVRCDVRRFRYQVARTCFCPCFTPRRGNAEKPRATPWDFGRRFKCALKGQRSLCCGYARKQSAPPFQGFKSF